MRPFNILLFFFHVTLQNSGNEWIELHDITISGVKQVEEQYLHEQCTLFYQSNDDQIPVVITAYSFTGHIQQRFSFDIHFTGQYFHQSLIVSNGPDIYLNKEIEFNSDQLKSICLKDQVSEYYKNYNIITNQLNQTNFAAELHLDPKGTFYITNIKIFIKVCEKGCKVCNKRTDLCEICHDNYIFNSLRCICQGVMYQGMCLQYCPPLTTSEQLGQCRKYISMTTIYDDEFGELGTFHPDYNTTQRNTKNEINGKKVRGPLIQNEYIQYSINYTENEAIDIKVELEIYLQGSFDTVSVMQFFVNEYEVHHIYMRDQDNTLNKRNPFLRSVKCEMDECLKVPIVFSLSQIPSLQSFQIKGMFNLSDQTKSWAFGGLKINKMQWDNQCEKLSYQNQCLDKCPPFTHQQDNQCQDMASIYKFYQYDVQLFYDLRIDQNSLDYFQFPRHDFQFFYYENRYIFGGVNGWWNQSFSRNINLSPHYKLRLFAKVILIDFQPNDEFVLIFENQYKYQTSTLQSQIGDKFLKDYIVNIDLEIDHQFSVIQLSFQCRAQGQGFCALYDLFLIEARCPINCRRCDSSDICLESSDKDVHFDCPETFSHFNGACLHCYQGCAKCSSKSNVNNDCIECQKGLELFDSRCFCETSKQLGNCKNCHPSCKDCILSFHKINTHQSLGPEQQFCTSCDYQEGKILNLGNCICKDGFFMNESFQCLECNSMCKTCENQMVCTSCSSSRILNHQQCLCKDGYFENNISGECSKCNDKCQRCQYHNNYCTQCYVSQFRIVQNYDCICDKGYYENGQNLQCQKCNQLCEHCINQNQCISCYSYQFRQLNNQNQCICKQGYYDINQICQQCHYSCIECNNNQQFNQCINKCPQTRYKYNINMNIFECKCKQGYYDIGEQLCINCLIYNNPSIQHYCYTQCGDKIIQWNEQCDDGNNNQRDGCDQCLLSNIKCQQNICLKCYLGECQQCINGYYLNYDYSCQKCQLYCQQNNKKLCQDCQECQINQGYIIQDNKCITQCGDGIKTNNEECDDGNLYNNDGCNQYCQIENGYQCQDICEIIEQLKINIVQDTSHKYYDNQRNINLYDLSQQIFIFPQFDEQLFKYNLVDKQTFVQLQIFFNQSIIKPQIVIQINNSSNKLTLLSYFKLPESTIQYTQIFILFNKQLIYILLGLSTPTNQIIQCFEILQFLSYLRYLTIQYPYNVEQYLKIFEFTQFSNQVYLFIILLFLDGKLFRYRKWYKFYSKFRKISLEILYYPISLFILQLDILYILPSAIILLKFHKSPKKFIKFIQMFFIIYPQEPLLQITILSAITIYLLVIVHNQAFLWFIEIQILLILFEQQFDSKENIGWLLLITATLLILFLLLSVIARILKKYKILVRQPIYHQQQNTERESEY